MVAFAGYPLLIEDRLVGVVAMFARHALTETTLQALASVSNNIAVGIARKRAAEELQWKSALLEAQVNSSQDGILVVDPQGKKILQNERTADLFKIPQAIADGNDDATQVRWVTNMTKNPGQFVEKVAFLYSHPNEISRDEIELKDGTILDRYSSSVVGKDAKHYGRIWTFRDITERKRLEAQLFQAQKMETVGRLAGGVAHEFNSLLTTILGHSDMLLGDLPAGSPLAEHAAEISQAAGRATTLTRQLLAYGRKQFLQPEILNLNQVLANMEAMFRHLMGGEVETQIVPAAGSARREGGRRTDRTGHHEPGHQRPRCHAQRRQTHAGNRQRLAASGDCGP